MHQRIIAYTNHFFDAQIVQIKVNSVIMVMDERIGPHCSCLELMMLQNLYSGNICTKHVIDRYTRALQIRDNRGCIVGKKQGHFGSAVMKEHTFLEQPDNDLRC